MCHRRCLGQRAVFVGEWRGHPVVPRCWEPLSSDICATPAEISIVPRALQQRCYGRWTPVRIRFSQHLCDRLNLVWGQSRGKGSRLSFAMLPVVRGRAFLGTLALCLTLSGIMATRVGCAQAGVTLEERKLPMRFLWIDCEPNCHGWVSAVGIVTADSPNDFDEFARGRDLEGATLVLDSSGGSVNDSIALGRRFRALSMRTTVGNTVETHTARGERASVA